MDSIDNTSLRPEFTSELSHQLLAGASLNMISPHGQGRRRTLQDLQHQLPASLQIIHMNIRSYVSDYTGFFNHACAQSNIATAPPENLAELLDHIESGSKQQLFILHNFDELRPPDHIDADIDTQYDAHFFHAINSIKQRTHIALLCVSECEYHHYRLQADGSECLYASINAEAIILPALNSQQVLAELSRRDISQHKQTLQTLSTRLSKQAAPYAALEQLFPIQID
ncbi:MAG: hypothetical protein Q9M16_05540 [Mariprofundus sp.]|nr:hypothetical protein [Mariprofundus sp.]